MKALTPTIYSLTLMTCFFPASLIKAQLIRQQNTTLTLPNTLPSASGYTLENAFGDLTFNFPICIRPVPGRTDRLFVVERGVSVGGTIEGRIQLLVRTGSTWTKSLFMTLSGISTSGENGMLSMAPHPNFKQNGYFYVFYSINSGGLKQRVSRFQATGTPGSYDLATTANQNTQQILIDQGDDAANHNGGDMHFGNDGYLYISTGDEGGADDNYNNSRKINQHFFSAILRIDVDKKTGNLEPNAVNNPAGAGASGIIPRDANNKAYYSVPADNPFIGRTSWDGINFNANTVRTEIWATGLRNPWRMSIDSETGQVFVADVGQGAREEINIMTSGSDGGWKYREGRQAFTGTPPAGFNGLEPIYDYGRSGTFGGTSVTGGVVYRGTRFPELVGHYIFSDFNSGNIWSIVDNTPTVTTDTWTPQLLTNQNSIAAFGIDPANGDVLLCNLISGVVHRLVRATTGTAPAATLSGTGAFSNLSTLTPAVGVVPYEVELPFWSDHAQKRRWFTIKPLADKMTFSTDGVWTFPTGQVWVKHFDIEMQRGVPSSTRRLETRFLVKNSSGAYGITYRWRADSSNADLVDETGLNEELAITTNGMTTPQTWRYPSRNECMQCHTAQAGYALGFTTRQMNRNITHGTQTGNQLSFLATAGYFTNNLPSINLLPVHARSDDTSKSLEDRVRSYLDVNCSSCHTGGSGFGNWDSRAQLTTDATGIINGALSNHGGNAARRLAVPGNAGLSMIPIRIEANVAGLGRMPPVGTQVTDSVGLQLIKDWINGPLATRQTFAQWQIANFGSASNPSAAATSDPDSDGLTNEYEYHAGLSPTVANTPPNFSCQISGSNLTINVPQFANRSVTVEASTSLETGSWAPLDVQNNAVSYPATNGNKVLTLPMNNQQRLFLRQRVNTR